MPFHVALLGDSIFDNRSYTRGDPDVITHLRGLLPPHWRASLLPVDGSVSDELAEQLPGVASEVTHLVISVGGNDALMYSDLLNRPVSSTHERSRCFGTESTGSRATTDRRSMPRWHWAGRRRSARSTTAICPPLRHQRPEIALSHVQRRDSARRVRAPFAGRSTFG